MSDPARDEAESLVKELREAQGTRVPLVARQLEELGQVAVEPVIGALSDPHWVVRFWAARILESLRDSQAEPALKKQRTVESVPYVKDRINLALGALRGQSGVTDGGANLSSRPLRQTLPTPGDKDQVGIALQRKIGSLRRQLISAYSSHSAELAQQVRPQLIEQQLALCSHIKGCPLTEDEARVRRASYARASSREVFLRSYHKWCWVCLADVDAMQNVPCGCAWRICECGACQCPDYSLGPKRTRGHPAPQPECQEQIARLGRLHYDVLVADRRARWEPWDDPYLDEPYDTTVEASRDDEESPQDEPMWMSLLDDPPDEEP